MRARRQVSIETGISGIPVGPDGGSPPREEALIEAARAGEATAFDGLVRLHYRRVNAAAFHLIGNPEDAEDLAQETFVRAHRALSWFRGDASFGAWLRRILVHLVRDRFRRQGRRPESLSLSVALDVPGTESPTREARARELGLLLAEALRRLPDHQRIALLLRTREGLAYADIADATGVTPATARTQVMKARRALEGLLARHLELRDR